MQKKLKLVIIYFYVTGILYMLMGKLFLQENFVHKDEIFKLLSITRIATLRQKIHMI